MKERPILMNAEMVRAILEWRKTQTRRIMKVQPISYNGRKYIVPDNSLKSWHDSENILQLCPYGVPGDRLWVRETWKWALGSGFCKPFERYLKDDGNKWGIGAIYKATPHPDYDWGEKSKYKP